MENQIIKNADVESSEINSFVNDLSKENFINEETQDKTKSNPEKKCDQPRTSMDSIKDHSIVYSNTTVPFFDIEYRTILKAILKNFDKEMNELPANKELFLLNKHRHFFERLFGFKFGEHKSILSINNQSLISLDLLYPDAKDEKKIHYSSTSENEIDIPVKGLYFERENRKKSFHVFDHQSSILNDSQAFLVLLSDQ